MSKLVNLKELTPKHHRMITALVLEGLTQKKVCERFDISETRLSLLRKDPLWKKEGVKLIRQFRDQCFSRIQQLAPQAIEALAESIKPQREDGIVIQLYAPGWATEDGIGRVIDVEIDNKISK